MPERLMFGAVKNLEFVQTIDLGDCPLVGMVLPNDLKAVF